MGPYRYSVWICIILDEMDFVNVRSKIYAITRQETYRGAFALATAFTVVTYPVYDNDSGEAKGLNTIADYEALEEMRTQPIDVHVHEENEFTMQFGHDDLMVPTMAWLDWEDYQPTRTHIIDFWMLMAIKIANLEPMLFLSGDYSGEDKISETGTFTITNEHWPSELKTVLRRRCL